MNIYKKLSLVLIMSLIFCILTPYKEESVYSQTSQTKHHEFKVDEEYSGFKLVENNMINEIDSNLKIFEHVKSGAELVFIENDDENKIFSIAFRTPVENNMGTPHVLEHSVLCGSEKFPVKHTFLTMRQQSLATYLNAATSDIYTYYTAASQNNKDFRNLMDVYLDAVFRPKLLKNPDIFRQEGINYSINSLKDKITYNGIVYNEMKGYYSNPSFLLNTAISKSLFPDIPYNYISGGDPDSIEKLTYDDVIRFYEKNYHPSNSLIYLYGNLDIINTLEFIDNNYLSLYKKENIDNSIKIQKPFDEKNIRRYKYGILENEDESNKTYLALNFVTGNFKNREENIIMSLICSYLNSANSPLKSALREAGLGGNVYARYDFWQPQPSFSFILKNSDENEANKFQEVISETLKDIAKNGIDREIISAKIKNWVMNTRTKKIDAYKGFFYQKIILNSWAFEEDLSQYLEADKLIKNIEEKIGTEYFEELILKYLINNKHRSLVILEPDAGLQNRKDLEEKKYLEEYKESLSREELERLIESNRKLRETQEASESSDSLKNIPILSLDDIDYKVNDNIQKKDSIEGATILHTPQFTNELAYTNFYFDSSRVPKDKLTYLYYLQQLIGKVSTEKYHYSDITKMKISKTGKLNFAIRNYRDFNNSDIYYPKFEISTYALTDELLDNIQLIEEIIENSKFDDIDRLKEITQNIKLNFKEQSPLYIVRQRLRSYLSNSGQYNSEVGGLEFYKFICEIEEMLDTNPEEVILNLQNIKKLAFPKQNLIIGLTASSEDYPKFEKSIGSFIKKLPYSSAPVQEYEFDEPIFNEGFITTIQGQYTAKGYNFKELNYEFNGKMFVLANIIDKFLMEEIRVKGGAYGADMTIFPSGEVVFSSHQDPNLVETLEIYNEVPNYIKEFKVDKDQMINYIISTYGKLNPLLSPWQEGKIAEENYIIGYTNDQKQRMFKEILETTVEDIRNYEQLIKDIVNKDVICVIGSENKIKEVEHIFNKSSTLFDNDEKPENGSNSEK